MWRQGNLERTSAVTLPGVASPQENSTPAPSWHEIMVFMLPEPSMLRASPNQRQAGLGSCLDSSTAGGARFLRLSHASLPLPRDDCRVGHCQCCSGSRHSAWGTGAVITWIDLGCWCDINSSVIVVIFNLLRLAKCNLFLMLICRGKPDRGHICVSFKSFHHCKSLSKGCLYLEYLLIRQGNNHYVLQESWIKFRSEEFTPNTSKWLIKWTKEILIYKEKTLKLYILSNVISRWRKIIEDTHERI